MASLFADENVPYAVVEELRALGHDVLTALDAGLANKRTLDEEVLRYATEHGRAVLTNNRKDFHRLHRRDDHHAGIVTFTDDRDCLALAQRIHAEVSALPDLSRRLIRVVRPG